MSLIEALIGQGLSRAEAADRIEEMNQRFLDGEDPEEILHEEGLEPDYVMEII